MGITSKYYNYILPDNKSYILVKVKEELKMDASKKFSNGRLLMIGSISYLFKKETWIVAYTIITSCILSGMFLYALKGWEFNKEFIKHAFSGQNYIFTIGLLFIAYLIYRLFKATLYYYFIRALEKEKVSFHTSWLQTQSRFKTIFLWQLFSFLLFIGILSVKSLPLLFITVGPWNVATGFMLPILMTTSLGIFAAVSRSMSISADTRTETIAASTISLIAFGPPLLASALGISLAINAQLSLLFVWLITTALTCTFFIIPIIWTIFTAALYLYAQGKLKDHFSLALRDTTDKQHNS
jgi:hypothetical protein